MIWFNVESECQENVDERQFIMNNLIKEYN